MYRIWLKPRIPDTFSLENVSGSEENAKTGYKSPFDVSYISKNCKSGYILRSKCIGSGSKIGFGIHRLIGLSRITLWRILA